MGLANAHYYATHDPFGPGGDFTTSPEISQMFGELVGLALADLWQRAGAPDCAYVELGPGRGTLATDALRTMRTAGLAPPVHFVETSARLRGAQRERFPQAHWHADLATLPTDRPLLIVANEFFDALPVRQLIRSIAGWREQMVALGLDEFALAAGTIPVDGDVPPHLLHGDPGGILELRPAADAMMRDIAARLARQSGVLLAFDYGHDGSRHGDTLQAVHAHAYADPLARPGASDLTAHVDFGALAAAAAGAQIFGPVDQGQWLIALGIADRAATLARASPDRAPEITAAYRRLVDPAEMGALFKAFAIVAPGWPSPAGFG